MTKETKKRLLPMDELRWRPCEVDGVPALFHRWIEEGRPLLVSDAIRPSEEWRQVTYRFRADSVVPCCCHLDVIRETFALVEFLDGVVAKVKPELVRFVDGEVNDEG